MNPQYDKLLRTENLVTKLRKLSELIEQRKNMLDHMEHTNPGRATKYKKERSEIESIQAEIDSLERRTVPGENERLTEEYIALAERYDLLGRWFSKENAQNN